MVSASIMTSLHQDTLTALAAALACVLVHNIIEFLGKQSKSAEVSDAFQREGEEGVHVLAATSKRKRLSAIMVNK